MSRYVFFNSDAQDDKVLTAAEKVARSHGATAVKSLAGTMLLEVTPAQVTGAAHALPGCRYSNERKTTRVPERKSLERFRARARGTARRPQRARSLLDQSQIPIELAAACTAAVQPRTNSYLCQLLRKSGADNKWLQRSDDRQHGSRRRSGVYRKPSPDVDVAEQHPNPTVACGCGSCQP